MGLLIDGTWQDQWYETKSTGGRFVRKASSFRDFVSAADDTRFAPEAGRYHLYVAMACPWAHRALLFRKLKGLEGAISVSTVHPDMLSEGWVFGPDHPDHLLGKTHLHQVYTAADGAYTGRVTVPILWDKQRGTVVNNESSEIIRMFDQEFGSVADPGALLAGVEMWPEALRDQIEEINAMVYDKVNNGVYKAGFATTQAAYAHAVGELFEALDQLEARLSGQAFLVGNTLTEADWRLFTTLLRFDPVYHHHFKCSLRRLRDYPNLWQYTLALAQAPGVWDTVDLPAIRRHYFYSHESINPHRIVPVSPDIDWTAPHDRRRFFASGCMPWE